MMGDSSLSIDILKGLMSLLFTGETSVMDKALIPMPLLAELRRLSGDMFILLFRAITVALY